MPEARRVRDVLRGCARAVREQSLPARRCEYVDENGARCFRGNIVPRKRPGLRTRPDGTWRDYLSSIEALAAEVVVELNAVAPAALARVAERVVQRRVGRFVLEVRLAADG